MQRSVCIRVCIFQQWSAVTSPHLFLPIGTSPHAPTGIRVAASSIWANVSWVVGYDGGFQQTFSVWYGHVWVISACFAFCFFLLPNLPLLFRKDLFFRVVFRTVVDKSDVSPLMAKEKNPTELNMTPEHFVLLLLLLLLCCCLAESVIF